MSNPRPSANPPPGRASSPGPAGERELFLRIVPNRVTGRRIKPA